MATPLDEAGIRPAHLWGKIKAQCLGENPFIRVDADTGKEMTTCPRCMEEAPTADYTTLSIEPPAMEWAASVLKCLHCRHLFAFVR